MSTEDVAISAFEPRESRFVVGIDLGTTNSAVAYVDMQGGQRAVQDFALDQWVDFATSERRDVLPSFHYVLTEEELATAEKYLRNSKSSLPLGAMVGSLARDRGLQQPGRQIASAKSWLCHEGVDRHAPLLPWQCELDVEKLSPVEATARILSHIRDMWDKEHRQHPLAEQDVILTLPASFDEVARELTVEAARQAQLPRIILIEEPQAAFYAWLYRHRHNWEQLVQAGQTILVCDIGGGTTDFTLIRVRANDASELGSETLHAAHRRVLSLHRVAVGEHLILGGDNLDLALAKLAEDKLTAGQRLAPRAWDSLRQCCRSAKEALLGSSPPGHYTINLPGAGSKLVAGGTRIELNSADVSRTLVDGFFPLVEIDQRPDTRQIGFQEFGLPYARDPAVTKHLGAFLFDHRFAGRTDAQRAAMSDVAAAKPDCVLFNGGVLAAAQIRERLSGQLVRWFAGKDPAIPTDWRPTILDHDRLDLAVARGAAYFGQVRRGEGVRIEAKLARSYYLLIADDPPKAVCIVPGLASAGDQFKIATTPLELALGEPVQFKILSSSTRLADQPGDVVEVVPEQFVSLPPIRTVLQWPGRRRADRIPIIVETELSEIGTLRLWCASPDTAHRWQLDFDVRGSFQTDWPADARLTKTTSTIESTILDAAAMTLAETFGPHPTLPPSKLMQALAARIGMPRQNWPLSVLRAMWQNLLDLREGCKFSEQHEARWLNLLGYCLRPGYGVVADDWRVGQTWRWVYGKLAFGAQTSRTESLILWRRIAGGFTSGQQLAVYQQIAGPLRGVLDPLRRAKGGGSVSSSELVELLRLVGSLELLPKQEKNSLGGWLIDLATVKKWSSAQAAVFWALGRIGCRVPVYGPLNAVVDIETVSQWLERMLRLNHESPAWQLAMMQCARKTGDRYRDIDADLCRSIVARLASAPAHYRTLVEQVGSLENEESNEILGESLPLGISVSK